MKIEVNATKVLKDILATTKRVVSLRGGTRSSKTYSLVQYVILYALQNTGQTISIVRKTLPSLKSSVLRDFITILNQMNLYSEENLNKTELIYKLNNNIIEFFSVDQPQKIRGRKRDILWCNEGNELDRDDFFQLAFRTIRRIFIDYNPSMPQEHWIYTELETRDDCELLTSTYKDNPFLEPEIIKEIERLKKFDPSYWLVFGEGKKAPLKIGNVFLPEYYQEYESLEGKNIISVIYCDPNLAIKAKGDTTAIVELGYCLDDEMYYVIDAVCESYGDPNHLLNALFSMKSKSKYCSCIGFDGNVNQESTWQNFVKQYAIIHNTNIPKIQYKKYSVDKILKSCQLAYVEKKIFFPLNFKKMQPLFYNQLIQFEGKKAGNPDDAPDALICAFEMLNELKITKKTTKIIEQPSIYEQIF